MGSRFFATGDTSSESEDASLSSDSDAGGNTAVGTTSGGNATTAGTGTGTGTGTATSLRASRFARDSDSDDDESDEQRVVRSAKDRRYDALVDIVQKMRNHIKINDWGEIQNDFDGLNKQLELLKKIDLGLGTGGKAGAPIPPLYLATCVMMEQVLEEAMEKKESLKLSKTNTKALNTMKQRLRKNNKLYEEEIREFREKGGSPKSVDEMVEQHLNSLKERAGKVLSDESSSSESSSESESESSSSSSESDSDDDKGAKKPAGAAADAPKVKGKAKAKGKGSESESESSASDADKPAVAKSAAAAGGVEKQENGDGSGSESDWGSDSESSSSSESSDDDAEKGNRASKWFVKEAKKPKKESKSKGLDKKPGTKKTAEEEERAAEEAAAAAAASASATAQFEDRKPEDVTPAEVDQRMLDIVASRGRKGTDKHAQVDSIFFLYLAAKSPRQKMEVLISLVSSLFDLSPSALAVMPLNLWRDALGYTSELLSLASKNYPHLKFSDQVDTSEPIVQVTDKMRQDAARAVEAEKAAMAEAIKSGDVSKMAGKDGKVEEKVLIGDLASIVERLDDELYKAYQSTDAYSQDYVERLTDDFPLVRLMSEAQEYFEKQVGDNDRASRMAARRINHLYYKTAEQETLIRQMFLDKEKSVPEARVSSQASKAEAKLDTDTDEATHLVPHIPAEKFPLPVPEKTLQELAVVVYRYGEERAKSQTMLCQIYNHALEDRFYDARDMLLMSHLQEGISMMDVFSQILFNRAMAQLGLCAFRLGMPWEAHSALTELCSSSFSGGGGNTRMKELLAQGIAIYRGYEKTTDQEKAERKRQVPYHMHINLEFLETAHLVSAMLLEIPNIALNNLRGVGMKRRMISKTFQYLLRNAMKQQFPVPPENVRDHVMAASRALMKGDWKVCYDYIAQMRAWKVVPANIAKTTLAHLEDLIKREGLRTYILTYSMYFDSISLKKLAAMFELPEPKVHSVISKMIINDELRASWDQPTGCIAIRRTDPTRMQSLALQLTQKCQQLADHNERLMEARAGGAGKDDEQGDGWRGGRGRGDRDRDREGGDRFDRGDRRRRY